MKYIIVLSLCLVLLLTACGNGEPNATTAGNTTGEATTTQATTEATAGTTAPEATTEPAQDAKALAESCIDKSVDELFALIGQPQSSDYAPSCNGGEGAEDGNLYYDGFIVYTLKEGDSETVVFVE